MNKDIIYGVLIVFVLTTIFGVIMWQITYLNLQTCKTDKLSYYDDLQRCNAKVDFLISNVTGIKDTHDYLTKVYAYSSYLAKKDKHPCNCTNFTATDFKLRLQSDYSFSMDREVDCGDTKYKEIIVFNYLAPTLKNWSDYTPSEFCLKVE